LLIERILARVRATRQTVGACVFFFVLAAAASSDVLARVPQTAIDFRTYYAAWLTVRAGGDVYDFGQVTAAAGRAALGTTNPYLYPPVLSHLLRSLAAFEPTTAQTVWWWTGLLAFGISAGILAAEVRRQNDAPWPTVLMLGAFLVLALNLRNTVDTGQVNLFVTALISLSLTAHIRRKDAASGALLAVAGAMKVTPLLLLLPFVAARRGRAVVAAVLGCAGVFVLSVAAGAWPGWLAFWRLAPKLGHGARIPGLFAPDTLWNYSLAGFFARCFHSEAWVRGWTYGVLLALLIPLVAVSYRARGKRALLLSFAPWLAWMTLASPLTYVHHMVFLFPGALGQLTVLVAQRRAAWCAALATAYVVVASDAPLSVASWGARVADAPLMSSPNTYALIVVSLVGLAACWKTSAASSDGA
jgi:alpha-1,2-mannosyltransferase